jgi:hypothetical protein
MPLIALIEDNIAFVQALGIPAISLTKYGSNSNNDEVNVG